MKTSGQVAYEKFQAVFGLTSKSKLTGSPILSWDDLESDKEKGARVREKWEAIAQAVLETKR